MIDFNFISIHPQFLQTYMQFGVMARASKLDLCKVSTIQLRDFATDRHGSIDDKPYGGGDGMVMRPEPLRDALQSFDRPQHVIFTTPGAKPFRHADAVRLAGTEKPLCFVCGRFGGVDQRFIDQYVDETFSLGDFVVSGGELPGLMIADAVCRQLPGALGNVESAVADSFGSGMVDSIEHPLFTRPEIFENIAVPAVLLSGDHKKITDWKKTNTKPVKKN